MINTALDQIDYSTHAVVPASIQPGDVIDVIEYNRLFTDRMDEIEAFESHSIKVFGQTHEPCEVTVEPTRLRHCTQAMHNALMQRKHNPDKPFTHPVFANTEFYKQQGRPNLLVMVGESWVYGGKIRDMNIDEHSESEHSFSHALFRTVGAVAADLVGADLYQYAYPGNNNYAMLQWLTERLPELVNLPQYDQVFVLVQHTDQVREIGQPSGIAQLCGENSVFTTTVDRLTTGTNTWQNIDHWLKTYTAPVTHTLNTLSELNDVKPVHIHHWGNFAPVTHWNHSCFTVHPQSWTQFNAQLEGYTIPHTDYSNAGLNNTVYTHSSITEQQTNIEGIEQMNHYWDNLTARVLGLHQHYPSRISHRLWAAQLTSQWRRAGLPSAPQKFWNKT